MDMYGYTKDLTVIVPDLSNIFIIDNSPGAYRSNPGKCIYVHVHRMDVHTYVCSNLHVLQLWDQLTLGCTCIRKYVQVLQLGGQIYFQKRMMMFVHGHCEMMDVCDT